MENRKLDKIFDEYEFTDLDYQEFKKKIYKLFEKCKVENSKVSGGKDGI